MFFANDTEALLISENAVLSNNFMLMPVDIIF
jgi:hypothetical protein